MKTIGIKLADGSFYPVLEEDKKEQKQLDLTTAHNNQTRVMVDMYRSATCSMEDAEYVDTLQIDNLVAHPNGQPDISFTVSLDDDKNLFARIVDEETGAQSKTTITLISRTEEERLIPDSYEIKEKVVDEEKKPAGIAAGSGLLAAAMSINSKNEEIPEENTENLVDDSLDDLNFDDIPDVDDSASVDLSTEDVDLSTEDVDLSTEVSDESMPDFNFDTDFDFDSDTDAAASDSSLDLDTTPDTNASSDTNLDLDFDTDFDFGSDTDAAASADLSTEVSDDSMPDFNFDTDFDSTEASDSTGENLSSADPLSFTGLYDSSDLDDDKSDLKKKTKIPVIVCITCAIICVIAALLILFVVPSKYNLLNKSKKAKTEVVKIEQKNEEPLVEKTEIEEPKSTEVGEDVANSTSFSILDDSSAATEASSAAIEEEIPQAKEDEIVVVEEAEKVIPELPPVVEEKPADIMYKVKWGDTLWDIADTYYKNPWKYKYLASYNKISNPDHIISGTIIAIPAE